MSRGARCSDGRRGTEYTGSQGTGRHSECTRLKARGNNRQVMWLVVTVILMVDSTLHLFKCTYEIANLY